jgi:hypothetical protein
MCCSSLGSSASPTAARQQRGVLDDIWHTEAGSVAPFLIACGASKARIHDEILASCCCGPSMTSIGYHAAERPCAERRSRRPGRPPLVGAEDRTEDRTLAVLGDERRVVSPGGNPPRPWTIV